MSPLSSSFYISTCNVIYIYSCFQVPTYLPQLSYVSIVTCIYILVNFYMPPFQTSSLPNNLIHFSLSAIIVLIHYLCFTIISLLYFDDYAPLVLLLSSWSAFYLCTSLSPPIQSSPLLSTLILFLHSNLLDLLDYALFYSTILHTDWSYLIIQLSSSRSALLVPYHTFSNMIACSRG